MKPQPERLALDFPFTEAPTAAGDARIREDLARIARAILRNDRFVRAVVLTGSYSRGEGTMRDDHPVNDYDLVALRARPGGGRRYAALAEALTRQVGIHVDLLPVWDARLPLVGRKLFWLDVALGGRVIAGDPRVLGMLRRFPAEDLPHVEIARLLGNRAAGMLVALPGEGEDPDPQLRDLQASKGILAAMDALLLSEGRYAAGLRERLAMTRGRGDHELYTMAVEWKLGAGAMPPDAWDQAASCLLRAVDVTGARQDGDDLASRVFYALRAKRLRWSPSRAMREAAWDQLGDARWPRGRATWRAGKRAFFAARALTLQ